MLEFWQDTPLLREELEEVLRIIDAEFLAGGPALSRPLGELGRLHGKMLRPGLLLLSAMFGDYDPGRMHRLAAAVEMLHLATLVHDDIIDDADLRRRQPTLHSRYGPKTAVLVGDYLFSRSFVLASSDTALEQARNLSAVVSQICASEIAQSADRFDPEVSGRRYRRRITGKTAMLFAVSCYTGAAECGAPPALCSRLRRLGYNVGMGFQIIDDILDYTGDPNLLGKPVGGDLREGVFTLPLILALRADDGPLRELLRDPPYPAERLDRILGKVKELGGIEGARSAAQSYTRRAMRELEFLPDGEPRRTLSRTVERLMNRRY